MGFLGFGGDKTTETTITDTLGKEDTAYINNMRNQAQAASNAATNGPAWAQGPNWLHNKADTATLNALGGMNQFYGLGQMGNQAWQQALGITPDMLSQYAAPGMQKWMQDTNPAYQQALGEAVNQTRVGNTLPGNSAMNSMRAGVAEGQTAAGMGNQRMAQIGNMEQQMLQNAQQMMMQDKFGLANMAGNLSQLGMGAMGQTAALGQQAASLGELHRQIGGELAQDPFNRARAGIGLQAGAFTQPLEQISNNKVVEQGGGWFGDMLGAIAPIAGTIFGGPIGGALGGALGNMFSGGGPTITGAMARATQPTTPILGPVKTW